MVDAYAVAATVEDRADQLVRSSESVARNIADGNLLVAEVDGRVVGNLGLHVEQGRRRDVGSIGMSVHDAYHGRGVGTALMQAMVELADRWLMVRRIELTVYTDNAAAVHLYEKFGFVIEGTARGRGPTRPR